MKTPRPKRYLYTPHLSDDNVRKLYQLARAKNLPMTRLLNQLVRRQATGACGGVMPQTTAPRRDQAPHPTTPRHRRETRWRVICSEETPDG